MFLHALRCVSGSLWTNRLKVSPNLTWTSVKHRYMTCSQAYYKETPAERTCLTVIWWETIVWESMSWGHRNTTKIPRHYIEGNYALGGGGVFIYCEELDCSVLMLCKSLCCHYHDSWEITLVCSCFTCEHSFYWCTRNHPRYYL